MLKPTHCRLPKQSLGFSLGSHTKLPGTNPPASCRHLLAELRIGPFLFFFEVGNHIFTKEPEGLHGILMGGVWAD